MAKTTTITVNERERRLINFAKRMTEKEIFAMECFGAGLRMAAGRQNQKQDVAADREQTPEGAAV